MSSVFSMEPEGITRAWPSVPLMSMKARMTQNQAMISLLTLALMEASDSLAGAPFLVFTLIASAFTIHLRERYSDISILAVNDGALLGLADLKFGHYMAASQLKGVE